METWLIIVIAVFLAMGVAVASAVVTNYVVSRNLKPEIQLVGLKFEKGYVALLWKDDGNPQGLPLQYAVFRKLSSSNSYEQIAVTNDTSFLDAPDTLNVQYTYMVVDSVAAKKGKQHRVSNRVLYTP